MKTITTIIAFAMLLVGCSQFPQLPQLHPHNSTQNIDHRYYWMKPGQANASSRVGALLYYADYAHNLGAAEYQKEVEHARLLYTQEKSDFRLLQYALALLVIHNRDSIKVQQLIEPLLSGNVATDPELEALAQLLYTDLAEDMAERRRLEAEIKRAETEAKRAEAGAKRSDELEKQVEAIKNIEKSMIERDKNPGAKQ
ncbi:MAG: hypothetical protein WAO76_01120 [Georgfuchsia sp.]